ncbi:MAG: hypothetical protein IK082_07030 [Oscillospiraceae bacterium]|nr:hypothetical protein [Oscillospiraceae bacterium]
MSGVSSWDRELFASGLEYVGPALTAASIAALAVGIAFLGYGLYEERRRR